MLGLRTQRAYPTLPSMPAKGIMPPSIGVIIPIARTNLVTNPSIELATTGYTASGGSIARSSAQQYHGVYSLAVTPTAGTTDGAYYAIALTSGTIYAFSCKFKGIAGVPYKISIATTAPADLSVYSFIGTGRWQWVWGYYLETSSTTRRFYITKNVSANTGIFYVDGMQVEAIVAGETVSTYIDGDQPGLLAGQQPAPYLWTGTPHASTSTRSILTRAGGSVLNFETAYNFLLTGVIGLGMAVPNNVAIPYTVLDGARYQRTTKPPRTVSLPGRFQADDFFTLQQSLSDMRQAFDRDLVPIQQPLILTVEPRDECGTVIGDFGQVQCLYAGGLEGNDSNLSIEDAAPTFTMYLPFVIGGDAGAVLPANQSIANANAILQRDPAGNWSAMGTGMTGVSNTVDALVYGLDGTLYAGGTFSDAGGSGADFLAKWSGGAWSVVKSATSLNGRVNALAVGPDGRIYVGGDFTNADGIAAADYIAVYDPVANTYAALGTGGNAVGVLSLAFDNLGNLYAGGSFTLMGGVANTVGVAKWDGSVWTALSTGLTGANPIAYALAVDKANNLYLAGSFATAGGVANTLRIAKWNGTAFSALSTGLSDIGQGLLIGPNGTLYVTGVFLTAGGVTVNYVARWNGTAFSALGTGFNALGTTLSTDSAGILYAGGGFTTASGIALVDRGAQWNGSAWLPLDVNFPGSTLLWRVISRPDGGLIAGFSTIGTATAATLPTVTNPSAVAVYPRVTIYGPTSGVSKLNQLVNFTTKIGIWFNLTMSVGEIITLDLDPQHPSYISTFQGDITSNMLPGSQPSLFYLAPGANSISFLAASNTVTAIMSWRNRYNGAADLVN